MFLDLEQLEAADRVEHRQVSAGTEEYDRLRERDADRRRQVLRILSRGGELSAADAYAAAWILNHGSSVDEFSKAHELARIAAEKGIRAARWLSAAALDKSLMHRGLPQRFGTNFVPDGRRYRLWDIEPATTDADRSEWDVRRPPCARSRRAAGW